MNARYGRERVTRGLTHFFVGKSVSALGGFFAMVLVVRGLTVADFASYSVLLALVEVFTAICGFGLSHVILRYVPELYVSYRSHALRTVVVRATALRSLGLFAALGLAWVASGLVASWIGLEGETLAFEAFLVVVAFRSTNQHLSLVLESTLHQGIAQAAFSLIALGRCLGMLWLLHEGTANLITVIWLEAVCELLAMLFMLGGIAWNLGRPTHRDCPEDDENWFQENRPRLIRFARSAYLQHLATLPFGGNTNRLVGGALFDDLLMARFGFAQSLYEYAKRYLPTQLLVGMIRPIVVSRYSTTRNFSAAAELCEQSFQMNLVLIAAMLALLVVCGKEVMMIVSGGKYGAAGISVTVLAILLVLLAFETQRLVLEVLAQMVDHYEILIPSNIFLSASVLGGIVAFPWLGALGFPLANLLALLFANAWVIYRLRGLGYRYRHDWRGSLQSLLILVAATAMGELALFAGASWVSATMAVVFILAALFLSLKLSPSMMFVRALVGGQSST